MYPFCLTLINISYVFFFVIMSRRLTSSCHSIKASFWSQLTLVFFFSLCKHIIKIAWKSCNLNIWNGCFCLMSLVRGSGYFFSVNTENSTLNRICHWRDSINYDNYVGNCNFADIKRKKTVASESREELLLQIQFWFRRLQVSNQCIWARNIN